MIALMMVMSMALSGPVDAATDKINARCAAKWGDDYGMQKFCRDKQTTAIRWCSGWYKEHVKDKPKTAPRVKIFNRCGSKWTDKYGPDWPMVKYCVEKQEKAYRELSR